ncbi:hypothetical protein EHM69_11950, partial [candidate division KSB1 bacterium]
MKTIWKSFLILGMMALIFGGAGVAQAGLYDAPYEMLFNHWVHASTPVDSLENWTNVGANFYTNVSPTYQYFVSPYKSVKFEASGDSIISPTIDNPDTVKVYLRSTGTGTAGIFKVYAQQGSGTMTLIHTCTWGSGNDLANAYPFKQLVLPLDASFRGQEDVRIAFSMQYKESGTNIALDDFSVTAYSGGGGDLTPPSISSVTVISNTALDVLFSEPVDQTTAETEANYWVIPGTVNPNSALRDVTNIALVHLTFTSALPTGTDTLYVNGVQDTSSNHNACSNIWATFSISQTVSVGDIRIIEVMYDDTATGTNPDYEWVELHNTTGTAIVLDGWYLTDDDTYPDLSSEGGWTIPAGTTIPANGYVVLSEVALDEITGEIVCTEAGAFGLGNSGDNLALYTAATGGTLIDGSMSVYYPDLSTPGYSIEKCDEDAAWDGSASAWHMSTNAFGTGRSQYCTPGAANTSCNDLTPPAMVSVTVVSNSALDVLFNEPLDQATAEAEANYWVMPGTINPSSALLDGVNPALVHLTFASDLPAGRDTLWVNGVEDTSSNNNACANIYRWFDIVGADVTPPTLVSVTSPSATQLNVLFNEAVDLTTAETAANYWVMPGNINPTSAVRDVTNLALVYLTFASALPVGTDTLYVNAVEDTAGNPCSNIWATFVVNPPVSAGDVVINEIMYDDSASTDIEWAEIFNRTDGAIDIGGWVLVDDAVYPSDGGEGAIVVPEGTTLPAAGYLVLCKADLPDITGEIICTQYRATWALGNTGDNLALYTDSVGGTLIDGTLDSSMWYPDWAGANVGASVEKCNEDSPWSVADDSSDWHASTNVYGGVGYRYKFCTPGATNSPCVADTVRPTLVSASAVTNTIVDVVFSEPVDETTAETVTNYSVDQSIGNPITATRQVVTTTVRLTFSSTLTPNTYTLTVNNVEDLAANAILPNSQTTFVISPSAYDIYVTEVMPDPSAVSDGSGEWFEIFNNGASAVDLTGWQVTDGEGTFTISAGSIGAGDYFVFCVNADSATNGGVPEDYVYPYAYGTGLQLSNTADEITLKDATNNIVATIAYTAAAFPWDPGTSMQLKNIAYNPALDTSWCAGASSWVGSMGDFGTPGLATNCGAPFIPDTVSICDIRVQDTCGIPGLYHQRVVTYGVFSYVDTCKATGYLQTGGCGLAVYGTPLFNNMTGASRIPATGDSIMIDGYITQFRGLTEISSYGGWVPVITLLAEGVTVPTVDMDCDIIGQLATACAGEDYESERVRVLGVQFINPSGTFPMADSNYAVLCGTDTIYFR